MRTADEQDREHLRHRLVLRRRLDRLATSTVVALAVIGGVGTLVSTASPKAPSAEVDVAATIGQAQLAATFARDFVVTWLESSAGHETDLDRFASTAALSLPPTGTHVTSSAVVFVRCGTCDGPHAAMATWSVTVAVTAESADSGAAASQSAYYRVAVGVLAGRPRGLAFPSRVAAPGRGPNIRSAYSATCPHDSPVYTTSVGFLAALLTGSGDISRYTTAGSTLDPLTPPPYTAIDPRTVVSDLRECNGADGATAHVSATLNARDDDRTGPSQSYLLTLQRISGRWQVVSLDTVPRTGDRPEPGLTSTTTETTSPSSSVAVPPATHN